MTALNMSLKVGAPIHSHTTKPHTTQRHTQHNITHNTTSYITKRHTLLKHHKTTGKRGDWTSRPGCRTMTRCLSKLLSTSCGHYES